MGVPAPTRVSVRFFSALNMVCFRSPYDIGPPRNRAPMEPFRVNPPYKIPRSVLVVIHTPDLQVLMMERAGCQGFWQPLPAPPARPGPARPGRALGLQMAPLARSRGAYDLLDQPRRDPRPAARARRDPRVRPSRLRPGAALLHAGGMPVTRTGRCARPAVLF